MYPAKKETLSLIIDEVRAFSRLEMRLMRVSFTWIAMQFFQQILSQISTLIALKGQFASQPNPKSQEQQIQSLQNAIDFARDQATVLGKEVVRVRALDFQPMIRKCVFEQLADLEGPEIKIAAEIKDLKLIKLVFEGVSDAEVSKTALTTLH